MGSFVRQQVIDTLVFVVFWQAVFLLFLGVNNLVVDYVTPLSVWGGAALRAGGMLASASFILTRLRLFIFEVVYKDEPYVTKRPGGEKLPAVDMYTVNSFLLWTFLGTFLFYSVGRLELSVLTVTNFAVLLVLWVFTDFFFFLLHRGMHIKPIFKRFHSTHHRLTKPNAYKQCEKFTYPDGVLHIVEYVIAYNILVLFIPIPDEIWLLGLVQWYIVGQLQHGGKSIPQNQIIGLELVRKLCRVGNTFSAQHDLHHTKISANYSMTGIYDKFFGTLVELEAK